MTKHRNNFSLNKYSDKKFYISLVSVVLTIIVIALAANYYRSKSEHEYVIIITPDGNTIAGYADRIYRNRHYAEITIDNTTYTVSYDNFIAMTTP